MAGVVTAGRILIVGRAEMHLTNIRQEEANPPTVLVDKTDLGVVYELNRFWISSTHIRAHQPSPRNALRPRQQLSSIQFCLWSLLRLAHPTSVIHLTHRPTNDAGVQ